METTSSRVKLIVSNIPSTDPTYKEWKLHPVVSNLLFPIFLARILPTRNGNLVEVIIILKVLFNCTDPTYKEWKLRNRF